MKELEYPFDAGQILANKRKIRERLLAGDDNYRIKKNIAVLGGSTTAEIRNILELFLLEHGIQPVFYESDYDQYYQDAVFPNEKLEKFAPDVIYVFTTGRNVSAFPALFDTPEEVAAMLEAEYERFVSVWEHLEHTYRCPVIQNNFEMPFYRLLGNRDASDIHGRVNYLSRLNMKFYEYAQTHENFFICDINYISADYGLKEWSDPFYWYMYKYALNFRAIPYLAQNVANIIKSLFGKSKKGFILDLDNTLWGGAVGEDGVDGIKLGPDEAGGQAYLEFQKYIRAHKQRGIILAVNSKNDEENAMAGLRHPDSILSPDDFTMIKANWMPKDKNLADIAEELGLMPDSFVFIDDSPAERHIVTKQLQGVQAPDIGEPHEYIINIDRNGYFEASMLTDDDARRNEMYAGNVKRTAFRSVFADYGEYLESLEMRAEISPFAPSCMQRITQLVNKSSQFNLTSKRYTQAELEEMAESGNCITLYGKLADRFGDNGIVSVAVGRITGGICHICLWLMSCRVLKRDMESAMMDEFVRQCQMKGIQEIRGYYMPTQKNGMVKEFYGMEGFQKMSADSEGKSVWRLDLRIPYRKKNKYIQIGDGTC